MIPKQPSGQPRPELPSDHKPRRFGRLRCEMLRTPLGKVLDLSAAGLRIEGKGKLTKLDLEAGQPMWLKLQGTFGELKLKTRVVWTEQTAPRRYQIGFELIELDAATRQHLGDVARMTVQAHVISTSPIDD